MSKVLEVLRGSVLCYDKGTPVYHGPGTVFPAPESHDHLISGDNPVCKVHVPAPVVVPAAPEPEAAEAPAEPAAEPARAKFGKK